MSRGRSRRAPDGAARAATSCGTAPIRFGTSGWRGILAEEITLPRVRALVTGVARWLGEVYPDGPARVLVAHDTRFLGPELVAIAVQALAAGGQRPRPAASPVPTPVVAHAVRRGRAEAALVFTASHNPPAYHGVKVIAGWGGGVTDAQARRIEALTAEALRRPEPPLGPARLRGSGVDLVTPYIARLVRFVERDAIRRAAPALVYDALHGAGALACTRALRTLGARLEVLHGAPSPCFGGFPPDPTPARLAGLAARLRNGPRGRLGLATDGDADRYAVIDADGSILSETEALALLVDRLARTGRARRGLAISVATGSLVERVAVAHGLPVRRFPIGFKHLARALAEGVADVAGEESGGFAVDAVARDKDGVLACALLAEIAAVEGTPLRARLRDLIRRHGASVCGRVAGPAPADAADRLARLAASPPGRVDGAAVRAVESGDGVRLAFDDGFLMLRASGTEPVVRLYGEAPTALALARRIEAGRRLLGELAPRGPRATRSRAPRAMDGADQSR